MISSTRGRMTKKKKMVKTEAILTALNSEPVDVSSLKRLAITSDGLLNDELRRRAWPHMLQVDTAAQKMKEGDTNLKKNRYYEQVVMDVHRSLSRFPPAMKDQQRSVLQEQLTRLIMRVLCANPQLHYYQGYHDVCVTFLLILGEDASYAVMNKLSNTHLRDFMEPTMDRTKRILDYTFPIVGKVNPELQDFLERSEVGSIFCLSWLITWFGHVLDEPRHTVRLFDFFLACDPLMPVYLTAAIILHREVEILASECEMCTIHQLLSRIPDKLPLEDLISYAGDLYLQFPKECIMPRPPSFLSRLQSGYSLIGLSSYQPSPSSATMTLRQRRRQLQPADVAALAASGRHDLAVEQGQLVKGAMWILTAVMGAAMFAMQYITREV